MAKGADFLVDGSSNIARRFKIPEVIIGLTIVAIGTSLPELIISVSAALQGNNAISMSNVIGSNFANLFLIISLCAVIKPLHMKKQTRFIDQPFVVLCSLILFFMVKNDGIIAKGEGITLLIITLLYIIYTVLITKFGKKVNTYQSENEEEIKNERNLFQRSKVVRIIKESKNKLEEKHKVVYSILLIMIGIIFLKFGGDYTVDGASFVAASMGLSQKLIGLTIVAIGTSLPELITCLEATKKGETDLAIGNIAGSQLFNIILILGASSAISPLSGVIGFLDEIILLIIGNLVFAIAPFTNDRHRVGRLLGMTFVVFYFAYIGIQVIENII